MNLRDIYIRSATGALLLVCCSGGFEGPPVGPPSIPDSYVSLAIHYNNGSVAGMMAFYSPSFRHDGLTARDLDSLLTYRLLDGSIRIKGVDAYPLYEDTLASCVIDVYYTRSGIRDTVHIEPGGEYDDISYWKKEGDYWKLNGNQLGTPVMEGGDSGE